MMLLASAALARQPGPEPAAEPVRREIMAFYDSREEARPDLTRIHRFAEMPLNHLGLVLTYWDVNAGLPSLERAASLRGMIAWFRRAPPAAFYAFARQAVARGNRMVVIGNGGLPSRAASLADVNALFHEIGFGLSGAAVDLTYGSRILRRDDLVGYERPLDPVLPPYPLVGAFGHGVTSHLVLEHRAGDLTLASSVVLTGDRGGYAADGYFIYEEPATGRTKWIVDPFAFFRKAFGVETAPIPDVTTLSGRRMWFSHIDGDGWNNVSAVEAYRDKPTLAAAVVLRELIAPYPDLPVSVGVIGADLDERYDAPEAARQAARELYALPQVEVATHTYTHPYRWSFFQAYDRELEERLAAPAATPWRTMLGDRLHKLARLLFPGWRKAADAAGERPAGADPPRAYSRFPFDLDQEIRGAIALAEEHAPEDKRGMLYLWSGSADPFEDAIARTRRLGLRNLNGGDSRYDADYPSISYLSAISRVAGAERQIYAANANDYIYLTDGGGRDHGFLHLAATIKSTEEPRRLKPIDVYYHMYAGEKSAQLEAVRRHLDDARQAPVTPVAASHYAAIADGFFDVRISPLGPQAWTVQNRGALQTVRFDDVAGLTIDFVRSAGVIGVRRKGDSLYVALDEAHADVIVALAPDTPGAATPTPYLIDGRWTFRDLRRRDCGFDVVARGYGAGRMTWGGLRPGRYRIAAFDDKDLAWEQAADVGEDGILAVTVDTDALSTPVKIAVACAAAGGQR